MPQNAVLQGPNAHLRHEATRSTSWHSMRSASSSGAHVEAPSGEEGEEGEEGEGSVAHAGRIPSSHGSSVSSTSGAVLDGSTGSWATATATQSAHTQGSAPGVQPSLPPALIALPPSSRTAAASASGGGARRTSSSAEDGGGSATSTVAMRLHDGCLTDGVSGLALSPALAPSLLQEKPAHRRTVANDKIFVSVVAYRDKECPATIADLFKKAAKPERVFVGLYTQCDPETDGDCLLDALADSQQSLPKHLENNIREVRQHWREARGPCWARHLAQQLASDEAYYFQIDSHMRVLQDWDEVLIQQLEACPAPKPVLSTYPAGYERGGPTPDQSPSTILCASAFGSDGMLRIKGRMLRRQQTGAPTPALFWAAGYSFSYSTLVREVPYDPGLKFLFFGEEMSMLARMWTSGYDVFAPSRAVVFHLWSRDYRPSFSADVPDYFDLRRRSLARVEALLGAPSKAAPAAADKALDGNAPRHEWSATAHINCCNLHAVLSDRMRNPYRLDKAEAASPPSSDERGEVGLRFGLGRQRSLAEFCEHTGVDFAGKTISDKAANGGLCPSAFLV